MPHLFPRDHPEEFISHETWEPYVDSVSATGEGAAIYAGGVKK